MKNTKSYFMEHSFSLRELRIKEEEAERLLLDIKTARKSLETLAKRGTKTAMSRMLVFDEFPYSNDFKHLGVYQATCIILDKSKKTMTTNEIIEALTKGGMQIKGDARRKVAATLYTAATTRQDSKISKTSRGQWKIVKAN